MKIWQMTDGEYKDGKYLVVRRDGTIPWWPNFVMGGHDPVSSAGLRAYAAAAECLGYEAEYVGSVRGLADKFEALAKEVKGKAKLDPEAPPHRIDNPAVVAMMRHETDLANYQPAQPEKDTP